jgi:hypothetical protein
MITTRQSIIDKINSKSKFEITNDEIQFILGNWITIHSQHLTEATLRFNTDQGVYANILVDKESFYKHF